jgi:hypothetical protein
MMRWTRGLVKPRVEEVIADSIILLVRQSGRRFDGKSAGKAPAMAQPSR